MTNRIWMLAAWALVLAAAQAQDDKTKKEPGFLGVSTEEVEAEELKKLGIESGVRITNVTEGSAAGKAGLKAGDIICKIDNEKIDGTAALSKTIQAKGGGTEVTVHLLRDGQAQELKAKLGSRPAGGPAADPIDQFPPVPKSNEPLRMLAAKVGTDIPWITISKDGPAATLDEAKRKAAEAKRLILWYVFRVPGAHIERYDSLDRYMLADPLSDPDVSDLIRRKFIPLRLSAAVVGPPLGLKALDIMEPALVFLRPDGTIVHRVDRLRSMVPDFILNTMRLVLEKEPALNWTDAKDPMELVKGGDYAKVETSDPLIKGILLRRQFKAEEALEALKQSKDPEARVEEAVVLFKSGRIADAKKAFEKLDTPRAMYYRGVCEFFSANEPKAAELWKELAEKHPDSVWAWKAASCASGSKECFIGDSGLTHGYADPLWPVEGARAALLSGSECPSKDMAKGAVRWLLRYQRSNGAWTDSRYIFGQGPIIQPNVWTAVTAIACTALLQWRDVDPEAVDRALERAMPYLLDEKNMSRGKYETSYADAFRLYYFSERILRDSNEKEKLVKIMNAIVPELAKLQGKTGFFWHEYPNCFNTAMVLYCLERARQAGADVPQEVLDRGLAALKGARSNAGTWPYGVKGNSAPKDASGRMPLCELVLLQRGAGSKEAMAKALATYLEFEAKRNRVRKSDFHADGELAGFFYFHSFLPAIEVARTLDQKDSLKRLREILEGLPEIDGSFAEDHEVGKSYSTAMALLCLKRVE